MNRRVRVDPAAAAELEDAAAWYDSQRRGLGHDLVVAARAAIRRASRSPQLGSPVTGTDPALNIRRVGMARFPYQVVYTTDDTTVHVIAVAHQRRLPGYWRDRLDPTS